MSTFARTRSSRATLVVRRGQRAIGSILGRQGGNGWRSRCEFWVWVVFVIELQYFRRLTTAKARRDYQSEINSGGHATASYAIAISNHTLLDGRRTEHGEKLAKPPMRCRLVTLHESGGAKDQ